MSFNKGQVNQLLCKSPNFSDCSWISWNMPPCFIHTAHLFNILTCFLWKILAAGGIPSRRSQLPPVGSLQLADVVGSWRPSPPGDCFLLCCDLSGCLCFLLCCDLSGTVFVSCPLSCYCRAVPLKVVLYLREPGSQSPEKLENLSGGSKNTSVRPHPTQSESVFFNYFLKIACIDLFLFGRDGSSLLHVGLLCLRAVSHCAGFSGFGVQALVVAHGPGSCSLRALGLGLIAVALGLSCSAACGTFPSRGPNWCPLP